MRILAVDDKAMPRRALVQAVEEAAPEAEVVACANAQEVLSLPDAAGFDVAFLDVDMPGMDGIRLARELKRLNPRVNVVFATAFGEYRADAFALHSSGYLRKPVTAAAVAEELENLRFPPGVAPGGGLVVQCFGDFEVFCDGEPLRFGRAKSKELLAYLVDRRGALVGLRQAEAALWEEAGGGGGVSPSYVRVLVNDLRRALDGCGHGDVLVRRRGVVGVNAARLVCDYYRYLEDDPLAVNAWHGEYMEQYSWAEPTKAALIGGFALQS
ncbi:MAG: response regulator [Eggerthellaceae bacterium]|nr:response regulator [Eggerthellaceae bacterium]